MRVAVIASALLCLAACASSSNRPADVAEPEVVVRQAGPIFFGQQATTPITLDVQITNRANVPLILRQIEVSSTNAEQYSIPTSRRTYKETIAPGETRTIQHSATGVAQDTHPRQAQPLLVRTFLLFEANGKTFRQVFIREFEPLP